MDRSANDLATFVEAFNLKNAIYIGCHGTKCVAKAVLISINILADRSQFFQHSTTPFYGPNRPNTNVSQGLQDSVLAPGDIGRLKTPR